MAMLRPSLTLVLDLDERLASEETVQEIRRCYMHICAPMIRIHRSMGVHPESEDAETWNRARMLVRLGTRKYLDSSEEGSNLLWDTVVERWLHNMLHKIGNNMKAFNRRQRAIGMPEVIFDRLDVELEGGELIIGVHPDPEGYIVPELSEMIGIARRELNGGALTGAARVDVPSEASYRVQYESALRHWKLDHRLDHPVGEADTDWEKEAGEPASSHLPASTTRDTSPHASLSREDWLEADKIAKSYENTAVPPAGSDSLPSADYGESEEEEPFTFPVEYRFWEVVFKDGRREMFDSSTVLIGA